MSPEEHSNNYIKQPYIFTYVKVSKSANTFFKYYYPLLEIFNLDRSKIMAILKDAYNTYKSGNYSDEFKAELEKQYRSFLGSQDEEEQVENEPESGEEDESKNEQSESEDQSGSASENESEEEA